MHEFCTFVGKIRLMADKALKQQLFEELSHISAAMNSPIRLEILEVLTQGSLAVETLAQQMGISIANASQHLQKLKQARLVAVEKRGKQNLYSLASAQVYQLLEAMIDLGVAQSAELQHLVSAIQGYEADVESIDLETLQERINQNSVMVIDVRPREEYQQGHIPGAQSLPLDELQSQLDKLPDDREIIAYCRGSLCTLDQKALQLLKNKGYQASKFTKGFPEWQAKGLAIEQA